MTVARTQLVDTAVSRWYHCISRVVRRARLLGEGGTDRKKWIEGRLKKLDSIFAVSVGGFAVLDNHLHVLLSASLRLLFVPLSETVPPCLSIAKCVFDNQEPTPRSSWPPSLHCLSLLNPFCITQGVNSPCVFLWNRDNTRIGTKRTGNVIDRRAMDGISHTQYDRAVERALDDFLDNRGLFSGKVSAGEAKEFAQCLYEGSVFDGPDAEKLRRFNAQVIRELRSGEKFVEPSKDSIEDLIKRGRSYAKTERGRAILRAAKLIAILGTVFSSLATAADATETIGNSSALRQALQNIHEGDYTAAERNLAGRNAGSLLSDLRSKGLISPYVEPLLEKELRGIPRRIKQWEESFCE